MKVALLTAASPGMGAAATREPHAQGHAVAILLSGKGKFLARKARIPSAISRPAGAA